MLYLKLFVPLLSWCEMNLIRAFLEAVSSIYGGSRCTSILWIVVPAIYYSEHQIFSTVTTTTIVIEGNWPTIPQLEHVIKWQNQASCWRVYGPCVSLHISRAISYSPLTTALHSDRMNRVTLLFPPASDYTQFVPSLRSYFRHPSMLVRRLLQFCMR